MSAYEMRQHGAPEGGTMVLDALRRIGRARRGATERFTLSVAERAIERELSGPGEVAPLWVIQLHPHSLLDLGLSTKELADMMMRRIAQHVRDKGLLGQHTPIVQVWPMLEVAPGAVRIDFGRTAVEEREPVLVGRQRSVTQQDMPSSVAILVTFEPGKSPQAYIVHSADNVVVGHRVTGGIFLEDESVAEARAEIRGDGHGRWIAANVSRDGAPVKVNDQDLVGQVALVDRDWITLGLTSIAFVVIN